MPRGGLREPPGGRPPKSAPTEVVKLHRCKKCKAFVGAGEHVCKPPVRRQKFVLPSMPPDLE